MPYQLGEEVLRSKPFSHILINDVISKVCDFCLISQEKRPLKCCSKCKRIYFCQTSCQESAWKSYHKGGGLMWKKREKKERYADSSHLVIKNAITEQMCMKTLDYCSIFFGNTSVYRFRGN